LHVSGPAMAARQLQRARTKKKGCSEKKMGGAPRKGVTVLTVYSAKRKSGYSQKKKSLAKTKGLVAARRRWRGGVDRLAGVPEAGRLEPKRRVQGDSETTSSNTRVDFLTLDAVTG